MDQNTLSEHSTISREAAPASLIDRINILRKEMNAVILAHYYQEPELQDIADFVGDSLELSRKAASTDAEVIIFCGVRFMADVAKIMNPNKLVLLPDMDAGCSLEDSCQPDEFKAFLEKNPKHTVLTYINSSIHVKGMSDIIVTSSNAEKIINQLPEDEKIIFGPDKYLGGYLNRKTGRDMLLWPGTCMVHERFSEKELVKLIARHPNAHVIAHPECPEELLAYAGHIGSTSSLLHYAEKLNGEEVIVITEPGIVHQMRKNAPHNTYLDVPGMDEESEEQGACISCNSCPYMRLNTLEKLLNCMENRAPMIEVDEAARTKALSSLNRMMEMSR